MTKQSYSQPWPAPQSRGPLKAQIKLPGSKSLNNRELVLSAIASEPTELIGALKSRDSSLMIEALRVLGTEIEIQESGTVLITPHLLRAEGSIDCGLAGTVMRFLPPLAALAQAKVLFDGDASARKRPMKTTIDSLKKLGVKIEPKEATSLPFSVESSGTVLGGELEIDASASSQFVSGLLLVACQFERGLLLKHVGEHLPSMPHIDMTIDCLQKRGVDAKRMNETTWKVEPGPVSGGRVQIEPDLSNAGPFLAAAMVAGGAVSIENWPARTTQVGNDFDGILQQMGAEISREAGSLIISGTGNIQGIDIDLSTGGELTPVIAALGALANSRTTIRGVAHLRGHETDRLAALVNEINSIGGNATETQDGLIIEPAKLRGGIWKCYEDHRMATAGAIIALRIPGIEIEDVSVTSKTMPDFVSLWENMLSGSN